MTRSTVLWTLAVALTIASAVYQRLTGPTYPLRGTAAIGGSPVTYRLERSFTTPSDAPIHVETTDTSIIGTLRWRQLGSTEAWGEIPMVYNDGALRASLPSQPPLGKLEYRITLQRGESLAEIPADAPLHIRFKGDVPVWVIAPHVLAMFLAMLFSLRAALDVFTVQPSVARLTLWTLATLFIGGFLFGPLMSYYAFDLFWTGWPAGTDITDNKTLVAFVGWVAAWAFGRRSAKAHWWAFGAAVLMFAVYMIPHSI